MEQLFETPLPNLDPKYPAPPPVPWWVLFAVLAIVNICSRVFLPKSYAGLMPNFALSLWGVYLCMWIRSLNPRATSIFWALGAFFSSSISILLSLIPEPTALVNLGIFIWILFYLGSAIASWYVARHDLLKHYNTVERVRLQLGPIMTFFFSYVYFQYHLCDIAEQKRQQAETLVR
jgi:hypothetical protein